MSLAIKGIIRGPKESKEDFLIRSHSFKAFPVQHGAFQITKPLFGIEPDWVEIVYSNTDLLAWQGACAFIEGNTIRVQLRKKYQTKQKLFGIYDKDELIAHELVHAARMAFDEPKFEEILAYCTSKSPFRRYFGPLFRSSKESVLFLLSFLPLSIVNPLYIPCCLIIPGFYLYRLIKYQRLFKCARAHAPLSKLIQLSDEEIIRIAKNQV